MIESFLNAYWSGDRLVLLRRDEAGTLLERRVPAEHVLYVKTADYLKIETECQAQLTKRRFRQIKVEGEFTRLSCDSPDFRKWLISEYLSRKSISSFEGDLHPVKRFLIDSECGIQKPICASIDLETDDRFGFKDLGKGRILCWSICRWGTGDQVRGVLEDDTDEAEREMLLDFFYELEKVDCLLAWNGDRFDFPYLKERIKVLKLEIDLRRWLLLDHMELFKKYNMHSAESGDEKDSVALERVAASLKIDVSDKTEALDEIGRLRTWDLWSKGGHERDLLSKRNVFDAWAMWEIERKTKYVDLHYAVCATSGVFPDSKALSAKNTVEGFVMRLANKRQYRFPTMFYDEEERTYEKFKGAFVLEVEPGIKRNVHVCDFAGMYPSIIESFNISPETWRPELSAKSGETLEQVIARLPPDHSVVPNTLQVFFTKTIGILALAVGELKKMRKVYNRQKDQAIPGSQAWEDADKLSQGAKITVNSCFGVAASPYSRLFVREVGESITLGGQYLIRETMKLGESRYGIKTIAGDTDSTFAVGVGSITFEEFVKQCNEILYPEILTWTGCARNEVVLEYEKELDLMISVAKKRYCARYKRYKGKDAKIDAKPIIKGFEYKRGDSNRMARRFQEEVIRKLLLIGESVPEAYPLGPTDFHEMIERWRLYVLEGDVTPRELILAKSLKKEIDQYDDDPVHVRIAKILESRGEQVQEGSKIEFVITSGDSPLVAVPASDYQKGCEDREYYWLKQVWPCVQRILEACWPQHRWDRFTEVPGKGGGKGRSKYGAGQNHFSFFWD